MSRQHYKSGLPIKLSDSSMRLISSFAKLVDLLVHLSTVVIPILPSTSNCERDPSRMPSTDTSNLAEPSVSLAGKAGDTPTSDNTLITLTLGHTNDIYHLIFLEYGIHWDLLLEEAVGIVYLVRNSSSIHLDLHQMGFLLLQTLHLPNLWGKCHNFATMIKIINKGR